MQHNASNPSSPSAAIPQTYQTVQVLRAIAALLVVVFHAFEVWGDRVNPNAPGVDWENGAAGVDIFFVISGFVMVVASRRLAEKANGWSEFLRHRVARIVPLYWLLTTVKLAAVLALPALTIRTSIDPAFITGSYLFMPVIDHAGNFRPLIPMGWTLTYEFLFYVMFAVALALRTELLRVVVPGLGAIALLGLLRDSHWPAWTILFSTIALEFIFGVILAKLVLAGRTLPMPAAIASLLIGAIAIMALPMNSDNMRFVMWGVPAFAIVAGAVSLESTIARWLPQWLLNLGDASYSIYLSHGFLVPVVILAIGRLHFNGVAPEFLAITLCLIGSAALGWLLYGWIELPLIRYFRARHKRAALLATPAR